MKFLEGRCLTDTSFTFSTKPGAGCVGPPWPVLGTRSLKQVARRSGPDLPHCENRENPAHPHVPPVTAHL